MKKILAFLALASVGQLAFAQTPVDTDYTAAAALVVTGQIVSSPTATAPAGSTCEVLSAEEPPVTINLSRQVVAAMRCNTTTNAVGGATQHPGGRPAACAGAGGQERCAYLATTAGGPVTAVANGTAVPATDGSTLTGCADIVAAITGGGVPTACQ